MVLASCLTDLGDTVLSIQKMTLPHRRNIYLQKCTILLKLFYFLISLLTTARSNKEINIISERHKDYEEHEVGRKRSWVVRVNLGVGSQGSPLCRGDTRSNDFTKWSCPYNDLKT